MRCYIIGEFHLLSPAVPVALNVSQEVHFEGVSFLKGLPTLHSEEETGSIKTFYQSLAKTANS